MLYEIAATFAYFALSIVILVIGFLVLDLITPGRLRQLVFVKHLPNAALITGAQQIALGIIIVSAILHSSADLLTGLFDVAVFGGIGVLIQTGALACIEFLTPHRFRDVIGDPKPRAGVFVAATTIIVISVINAACIT
ncbi:DUF350 domain-containing protein [Corynebacterium freiburgense]|uniref:DUF350 domain-containing protein n=1 Tax=Corynebacterium freiburgense TaxID=556548 RepID=UPI00042745D7|nr:DUF350 domain-containing protein [Corynebacterium freiburgense]WJZ02292.1 hypothetical protein CFREI_04980 [Corynebacterium freiburgense]